MSELQKGTAVIPTIDANGATVSQAMCACISEMVEKIKHLPLEVEMHPDQAAAWDNCKIRVSTIVAAQFSQAVDMLKKANKPALTFAGFPVKMSIDYPRNEIRVVFDSKGCDGNGKALGPMPVAVVFNLGLPDCAASATITPEMDGIVLRRDFCVMQSSVPDDPSLYKYFAHEYTEADLLRMFNEWDKYCATLIKWAKENNLDLPSGMPDQIPQLRPVLL